MFRKLLIANRGEIACRIIRTARQMGIETVAVYSTADRDSLHVALADQAFCIGEPAASKSYLNIETIIETAKTCGAEAIHPGYGFLSENPHLARACAHAGLVFVGPSVEAIEAMASKQLAKQRLEHTDVPLTPGYHGEDQSDERLLLEAKRLGFPVLLKAASGGGGKGMRAVQQEADFYSALAGARREAKASFADDTMLIEKLICNPRHVEIQIMADHHGHIIHLHERDCSIQRRHQKIIEEAPAPNLPQKVREGLANAAITVARAIDYRGAGTVEFLVDQTLQFYFMEMNTRLQVEHPVTEMITKLDLVEWQLRIAANEPLPYTQAEIQTHGHAIECRVYAEDPRHDFIPSTGQIHFLQEPVGEGLRLDTGVRCHSTISMHYDPMIAKLIAWGETREQALQRLQQALKHYHLGGVKTNIPFLQAIIQHPAFVAAKLRTDFLTEEHIDLPLPNPTQALLMAASYDYLQSQRHHDLLQTDTFAWQMHLSTHWSLQYLLHGEQHSLNITPIDHHTLMIQHNGITTTLYTHLHENYLYIDDGLQRHQAQIEPHHDQLVIYMEQGPITVARFHWQSQSLSASLPGAQLHAPMPATVVAILKNKGDHIKAGERLIVLEAMKMEHTLLAPHDGLIVDIFYEVGEQVHEGAELVTLRDPSTPEITN